jgi:hypothetical protein
MRLGTYHLGGNVPAEIEVANDDLQPGDEVVATRYGTSQFKECDLGIVEGWKAGFGAYPYGRSTERAPITVRGDRFVMKVLRWGPLQIVGFNAVLIGDLVLGFWTKKEFEEEDWCPWGSGPERALGWVCQKKTGLLVMAGDHTPDPEQNFMFDEKVATAANTFQVLVRRGLPAVKPAAKADDPFPHDCLYCGRKAYISALSVEHKDGRGCRG